MVFGDIAAPAARIFQVQLPADIIVERPAAGDGSIGVKRLKCAISEGARGIGDDKGAEIGALGERNGVGSHREMHGEANGIVLVMGGDFGAA
jgi:hypothetical protein